MGIRAWLNRHPVVREACKRLAVSPWLHNNAAYRALYEAHIRTKAARLETAVPSISLEVTNRCNARCRMCARSRMTRPLGEMRDALFKTLVDQVVATGARTVSLNIFGEPLMDSRLFDRIEYLREKGISCGFFSNGELLDEEKSRRLIELQVSEVTFSIDAFEPSVYESIRCGLSRERVYGNVLRLIRMRRQAGSVLPRISVTALKMRLNAEDLPRYVRFWRDEGVDGIVLGDLRDWAGLGADVEGGVGCLVRPYGVSWMPPCRQLWGNVNVLWDGRVVACCDDAAAGRLIIGDAATQTLGEILRGEPLKRLRDLHVHGRAAENPVCRACGRFTVWW